jgi:hypothetical protein
MKRLGGLKEPKLIGFNKETRIQKFSTTKPPKERERTKSITSPTSMATK